ncbi:MAG: serine/threonine-protein kinase, partial [Allosphingosinicella sp.]
MAVPRTPSRGIQVGDVLNHIFEVKRFIARGGMGEVFEGANVNSEERVAIKVMLPALAADRNVISMFRKEARTLTRLQHEALVQYRVLAQEPQLGVLYIVTEYIDGVSLSDVLSTLSPSPAELEALLRRLAGGLRTAHMLGAIHRDMSPDNVLLEGGRLAAAKIIDFGIAKNLDPGSGTIVGDGFAGKLGYVAPEQLGDFGRDMGPWTDVYSLALVILAIARGRDVQMGGSLVDAVDKRRSGPDLSAAPDPLRPVLEKMLRPNPAERLRSMDEVLEALDRSGKGASPEAGARKAKATIGWPPSRPIQIAAGAGAGGLALLAGIIWLFSSDAPPVPQSAPKAQVEPVSRPGTPDEARRAIQAVLPSIDCSWLDVSSLEEAGGRIAVRFTGVARSPAPAQAEISRALASAGFPGSDLDFGDVAQNESMNCKALDALRQIRVFRGNRISVPSRTFEIKPQPDNSRSSKAVIDLSIGNPSEDLAVVVLDPSGEFAPLIRGRAMLNQYVAVSREGQPVAALGNDRFEVLSYHDRPGWTGILLLTGRGPFD